MIENALNLIVYNIVSSRKLHFLHKSLSLFLFLFFSFSPSQSIICLLFVVYQISVYTFNNLEFTVGYYQKYTISNVISFCLFVVSKFHHKSIKCQFKSYFFFSNSKSQIISSTNFIEHIECHR